MMLLWYVHQIENGNEYKFSRVGFWVIYECSFHSFILILLLSCASQDCWMIRPRGGVEGKYKNKRICEEGKSYFD